MDKQSKKIGLGAVANKLLAAVGLSIHRTSARHLQPAVIIPAAQGREIKTPIDHNTRERINEYYSNPETVSEYLTPKRLAAYRSIVDLCLKKGIDMTGKTVADIGCGTGHLLKFVSETFAVQALTGLEYSEAAIAVAAEICPQASFIQFDIYEGISRHFDVLFCVEVLEHLLYPDKALRTCLGMLSEGSVLVITVPDGRKDTFLGHINFWSPESWRVYIESHCATHMCETGSFLETGANYAIIRARPGR